jgi:hypothetical protein
MYSVSAKNPAVHLKETGIGYSFISQIVTSNVAKNDRTNRTNFARK